MTYLIWFITSAVLIIFELLTASLIFGSFAVGSVVAAIAAMFGADLIGQGTAFAIASVLAIFLLRPMLAKRLETKNSKGTTNVMALIGATGVCTLEITSNGGQVKVRGEVWSARSNTAGIAEGQPVEVTNIDGATLIVKPTN